jgi:hypothetical protein
MPTDEQHSLGRSTMLQLGRIFRSHKHFWAFAAIISVVPAWLYTRLAHLDYPLFYDEARFLNWIESIADGHITFWQTHQPPVFSLAAYPFCQLAADSYIGIRVLSLVSCALITILTWWHARANATARTAFLSVLLLTLSPVSVVYSRFGHMDVFHSVFTFAGLLLLIHAARCPRRVTVTMMLSACCFVLAFLTKYNSLFVQFAAYVALLLVRRRSFGVITMHLGLTLAVGVLVVNVRYPELIFNIGAWALSASSFDLCKGLFRFARVTPFLCGAVPLSVFVVSMIRKSTRSRLLGADDVRFFLLTTLVYILLFVLGGRYYVRYLVHILPIACYCVARAVVLVVDDVRDSKAAAIRRGVASAGVIMLVELMVYCGVYYRTLHDVPPYHTIYSSVAAALERNPEAHLYTEDQQGMYHLHAPYKINETKPMSAKEQSFLKRLHLGSLDDEFLMKSRYVPSPVVGRRFFDSIWEAPSLHRLKSELAALKKYIRDPARKSVRFEVTRHHGKMNIGDYLLVFTPAFPDTNDPLSGLLAAFGLQRNSPYKAGVGEPQEHLVVERLERSCGFQIVTAFRRGRLVDGYLLKKMQVL